MARYRSCSPNKDPYSRSATGRNAELRGVVRLGRTGYECTPAPSTRCSSTLVGSSPPLTLSPVRRWHRRRILRGWVDGVLSGSGTLLRLPLLWVGPGSLKLPSDLDSLTSWWGKSSDRVRSWVAELARLCGQSVQGRPNDYVRRSRVGGQSHRIILSHIIPTRCSGIVVSTTPGARSSPPKPPFTSGHGCNPRPYSGGCRISQARHRLIGKRPYDAVPIAVR